MNIVRTVARKSSNRLKFFWLKGICCICQSKELEREIKQKPGGPSKEPVKNLVGCGPPSPPLEPPLFLVRRVSVGLFVFQDESCRLSGGVHCQIISSEPLLTRTSEADRNKSTVIAQKSTSDHRPKESLNQVCLCTTVLKKSVHGAQCVVTPQLQQNPSCIIYVSVTTSVDHTLPYHSIVPNVCS